MYILDAAIKTRTRISKINILKKKKVIYITIIIAIAIIIYI